MRTVAQTDAVGRMSGDYIGAAPSGTALFRPARDTSVPWGRRVLMEILSKTQVYSILRRLERGTSKVASQAQSSLALLLLLRRVLLLPLCAAHALTQRPTLSM